MVMLGRSLLIVNSSRTILLTRTSTTLLTQSSSSSAAASEGYVSRNRKMGRPLSPSLRLMISHPDMVWGLSFAHRTSGAVLTAGVMAGSITYLVSGTPFPELISPLQSLAGHTALWTATKFVVALPLCYHMVNGIRHLAWDTGRGFQMKTLYKSGYTMLIATLILTGALTFYKPSK